VAPTKDRDYALEKKRKAVLRLSASIWLLAPCMTENKHAFGQIFPSPEGLAYRPMLSSSTASQVLLARAKDLLLFAKKILVTPCRVLTEHKHALRQIFPARWGAKGCLGINGPIHDDF
jgi:hypothetical protein